MKRSIAPIINRHKKIDEEDPPQVRDPLSKMITSVLEKTQQIIVVTCHNWNSTSGQLYRFERQISQHPWLQIGDPMPVVTGRKGLAWSRSSLITIDSPPLFKIEGDLKSPAGVLKIGTAFGFYSKASMGMLKLDYFQIKDTTEAINDPKSSHYNTIVDSRKVIRDWKTSEKMHTISLYEYGLVIHHNFPFPTPNDGSAIFIHQWRDKDSPTEGCTALSQVHLNELLCWIDKSKNPLLVQLPIDSYSDLVTKLQLPNIYL